MRHCRFCRDIDLGSDVEMTGAFAGLADWVMKLDASGSDIDSGMVGRDVGAFIAGDVAGDIAGE
ncbi:MAG: hypothetical protein ACXVA4_11130 [Ktedonobacterales bacterium]